MQKIILLLVKLIILKIAKKLFANGLMAFWLFFFR